MNLPVPTPTPPPAEYTARMADIMRTAIENRNGVGLWSVVQQIRTDGYPELADDVVRGMVVRALERATTDPVAFAYIFDLARDAAGT